MNELRLQIRKNVIVLNSTCSPVIIDNKSPSSVRPLAYNICRFSKHGISLPSGPVPLNDHSVVTEHNFK